uniref:4-hydroxy-2-oxoglutarate aldolase, mitochondrial n=1 Tax=Plectus sambesii TaxID=2011161 RepID=A0A914UKG5_9BILA
MLNIDSLKEMKLDISGIYPPIVTPFHDDADKSLALEKLEENFAQWETMGFRGYVVLGSNGEFPNLTEEEKILLVSRCRHLTSKLVIAGAGCESTSETIKLCNEFAGIGVDAVLIITPCFYKNAMTPQALEAHYRKVADHSKVPVILYSVPANTGIDLSAEVVIALASHPNIVGLKDSGGDIVKLTKIVHATRDDEFQVLAGSAGFLLPALHAGCVGGVNALANVLGNEVVTLYDEFKRDPSSEVAKLLQGKIIDSNAAVTRRFGVPALKFMLDKRGFYGGPVREPLLPLTTEQKNIVGDIFIHSGLVM